MIGSCLEERGQLSFTGQNHLSSITGQQRPILEAQCLFNQYGNIALRQPWQQELLDLVRKNRAQYTIFPHKRAWGPQKCKKPSGIVTFRERSMPIFIVPEEEAQVPQAPCQTTTDVVLLGMMIIFIKVKL